MTRLSVSLKGERWKTIEGFSKYLVSNYGRIYSLHTHKLIALDKTNFGFYNGKKAFSAREYYSVKLYDGAKCKHLKVHRLVALAFCNNDDPLNNNVVDHIDNDPFNNTAKNLRWVTCAGNSQAARNGQSKIIFCEFNEEENMIEPIEEIRLASPDCNKRLLEIIFPEGAQEDE